MTKDSSVRSGGVDQKALLLDILALDKAIDDFLDDLRTRAGWGKANVDDDGTVVLPCGNSVLYRLGTAREQIGKHLPALAALRKGTPNVQG